MTFFRIRECSAELFYVEFREKVDGNWAFLTQFLNYCMAKAFLNEIRIGKRDKKGNLIPRIYEEIEI